MKWIITILFPLFSFGQNADWKELQSMIDTAVKYNGIVEVKRNYTIDFPLVAAKWDGKDYKQFTIQIIGYATMWDVGQSSVIKAKFKDAPILSIHKGKGCVVKGINFQGAGVNGRDSRFSPYCAVAIDPFRFNLPRDSGYTPLRSYYRGSTSKGGSTGLRFEDCTFGEVVVGAITSPNGYTQNAEMITFQNIRIGNCKVGIAGCQPQEKMNRVINIGCWSTCETLFGFNLYGETKPGNWVIDGVNIAGKVDNLVNRSSHGYFPLYINNVYAESLLSIGHWQSLVGDALTNASINFRYPANGEPLSDFNLSGGGVSFVNCDMRYYIETKSVPILVAGTGNTYSSAPHMIYGKGLLTDSNITRYTTFKEQDIIISQGRAVIQGVDKDMKKGDLITFFKKGNWEFAGQGLVDSVGEGLFYVTSVSSTVAKGGVYGSGRLK
jgi:hypothetical protein